MKLHPPGSTATVQVSDEKAARLLEDGWTAAGSDSPAGGHVCDVCGRALKTQAGLLSHRRSHDQEQ